MTDEQEQHKHQWRDYRTASGTRPVNDFIKQLSPENMATVRAAMKDVAREGLAAARHVRGEIYEVRAAGNRPELSHPLRYRGALSSHPAFPGRIL